MTGPYHSPTTLDSSRYNVAPFQKIALLLNNVDRSNGDFQSWHEGDTLIFTRVDFPVLVSFVNQQTQVTQTIMATPGGRIVAPFKGLTFTHPLLTVNTYNVILEFQVGKGGAIYDNSMANPYPSIYPPFLITADTAVAGAVNVYIPPGARYLNKISLLVQGTTTTGGVWQFFTANGVACGTPPVTGFPTSSFARGGLVGQVVSATLVRFEDTDIPIPSSAAYMQLSFGGTGLSLAGVANVKASFQ